MSESNINSSRNPHIWSNSYLKKEHGSEPLFSMELHLDRDALEKAVTNYETALDYVKILSYYFQTRAASDALEEMKQLEKGLTPGEK